MADILEARLKQLKESRKDRITGLPTNIVTDIISRLPIRDAGKTSLLSKKWRHKWLTIPSLIFDDKFAKSPLEKPNEPEKRCKLLFDIFQILLRHNGPLHKFSLSITKLRPGPEIDQIVLYLSGSDIQVLEILMMKGVNFLDDVLSWPQKMPSCLFSMLQLRTLRLRYCHLKSPPLFKGFSKLTSLEFDEVYIDSDLSQFISDCPSLLHLKLRLSSYDKGLVLDAPNLKSFSFEGPCCEITFKNTPALEEAQIHSDKESQLMSEESQLISEENNSSNFVKVLGSLPLLESLFVSHRYLKYLAIGGLPDKYSTKLKVVKLTEMHSSDTYGVSSALCLLRSSPELQMLHIEADQETLPFVSGDRQAREKSKLQFGRVNAVPKIIEAQEILNYAMNQLRCIRVSHMAYLVSETDFVKFLLKVSPHLEKMKILTRALKYSDEVEILKEHTKILECVTRFRRASHNAEVVVKSEAEA